MEPAVAGRPDAMVALARQFAACGEQARAVELAFAASEQLAGDGNAGTLAGQLLSDSVPRWHFNLLRDTARNQAYEDAIRRAVTPGCLVLEIGTGSGILAMMAARAGARVVTCEADPSVAAAARAVIAANGYADRVTVINKHSTAVDPAADLPELADILVSEIVSNDLLSEYVLPAHADAVARLLKPGAPVIPARGRVRVALAEDRLWEQARAGTVSGFDLSPFNRIGHPSRQIAVGSPRLTLRSEPADIFDFDFAASPAPADASTHRDLRATGGPVNGIVQWIALDFDDQGTYENPPLAGSQSSWALLFWPFAAPMETVAGDIITAGASHLVDRLRLWREPPCY
jgi:type II protein arginine methyltransferase